MPEHKPLRSDIAWSTPDRITVKGMDLCGDILGKLSLGDMAFLELTDRLPSPQEATVFNALAVLLVEHGVTPSAIVTRMTLSGAPEAMQAAARMLQEALPDPGAPVDIEALARALVDDHRKRKRAVPGIGHRFHKPVDPRAPKLFEIAAANGFSGKYVALIMAIARHAEQSLGKPLPVN